MFSIDRIVSPTFFPLDTCSWRISVCPLLIFIMILEMNDYQYHSPNVLNRVAVRFLFFFYVSNFVAFQKRRKDE